MLRLPEKVSAVVLMAAVLFLSSGCTSIRDYVHKGFKVGPNYCQPEARVAEHWIDEADLKQDPNPETICHWWKIFKDPKLDYLIDCACRQNLTLKEAGFRILQARAQYGIAAGNLFPQQQNASGSFRRIGSPFSDLWSYGFNLSWELDFWGRYRRAVAAADDNLEASVDDYDGVLVTLLGDVAQNYVQIRTDQERIRLRRKNIELQQGVLDYFTKREKIGFHATPLDTNQAISTLKATEAGIPQLEIDMRQSANRLCTLLGMPTEDLIKILGTGNIPETPQDVAVGIPADLLRRRPDVCRAERLAASQGEQIGIAQAALYPAFSINGTLGYSAQNFSELFENSALSSSVGPSFQWNLLNYGRIANNVRLQDAKFQELVLAYQNTVLLANEEVEDGLITFLRSQKSNELLKESVDASVKAVNQLLLQLQVGMVDFNRYAVIAQNLVSQQDSMAASQGQIAQGLIAMYRALGGGWEMRPQGDGETAESVREVSVPESVPTPKPETPNNSKETEKTTAPVEGGP
jgi:NodT family efflux transporter outer membrane factor (OMF) lipoprotein